MISALLRRLRSVRSQLLLSYLAIMLPALLFGILWTAHSIGEEYDRLTRRAENEAARTAGELSTLLGRAESTGRTIATLTAVRTQQIAETNAILAGQLRLNPLFNNIAFVNAEGVRVAAGDMEPEGNIYVGDRAWFSEVTRTGRTAIAEVAPARAGRMRGRPVITVAVPVHDMEDRVVGAVAATVSVEDMQKALSTNNEPRGLHSYVVDQQGRTVVHPDASFTEEMADLSALPPVHSALKGEIGHMEFTEHPGNAPYLAAYQPVPGTPFAAVAVQPLADPRAGILQTAMLAGGVVVLTLLLALLLSLYIGGGLARDIGRLATTARTVGAGELGRQVDIDRRDEVGGLARSFNQMSASLASLVARLSESERALRRSQEEIGSALAASLDLDQTLQVAMRATIDTLGVEGAAIGLLDEKRHVISWRAAIGPGSRMLDSTEHGLDDLRLVAARVVTSGQAEQVSEVASAEAPDPLLLLGTTALLVVPLTIRTRHVGVMAVYDTRGPRLFEEEIRSASAFANQAAAAIDNARAHEKIQRLLGELREKNAMLSQHNEELQAQNEEIQAQQEEIQTQSDALMAQNAVLKELDHQKDEFLSFAAHELKNPMASLKGYAQLLGRRAQKDSACEPCRPQLGTIDRQVSRLSEMVSRLLDLSRVQMGRLDLCPGPVNLVELTCQIAEQIQGAAHEHRIAVQASAECVSGSWDSSRVEQVLANLVGNAVKYSPAHSEVRIEVREEGEEALVVVRDQGIGIPPQEQPRIFEKYHRARGARESGVEGLGLGLYLSKEIVHAHRGRIWVESEGEGRGSAFAFALPLARTAEDREKPAETGCSS